MATDFGHLSPGRRVVIDRWHLDLAAAAIGVGLMTGFGMAIGRRYPTIGRATTGAWFVPLVVLAGAWGLLTWAQAIGMGVITVMAVRAVDRCSDAGPNTDECAPALFTVALGCAISLWGVWAAVPDTELPLMFAAGFLPIATSIVVFVHRSPLSTMVVPTLMLVALGAWAGSASTAQFMSGLGCAGALTIIGWDIHRHRDGRASRPGRSSSLLGTHFIAVFVCSRIAHTQPLWPAIGIVAASQVLVAATVIWLRRCRRS